MSPVSLYPPRPKREAKMVAWISLGNFSSILRKAVSAPLGPSSMYLMSAYAKPRSISVP